MYVRTLARVLTAGLLGGAVLLAGAEPAAAHAQVVSTSPAKGATVTTAPTQVSVTFNEPVRADLLQFAVTDQYGQSVTAGTPAAVDTTARQALGSIQAGYLTVAWRAVSADGHPIAGTFSFRYAPPPGAAPSAADSSASPPPADPSAGEDEREATVTAVSGRPGDSGALGVLVWIVGAVLAAAVLVGLVLFAGWLSRRRVP
jgi:methionine-rich copper-binding protein CopC